MTLKTKPLKQQVKDCLELIDEQKYALNVAYSEIDFLSYELGKAKDELSEAKTYITRWRKNFDIANERADIYISNALYVSIAFNILVIASIIWKWF